VLVADGLVSSINDAAAALLKLDPEQALGQPAVSVLRDHRIDSALAQQAPFELNTRGRTLQVVPFLGGFLLRDVTEARRAEENARELLAVLSHELRTPVTTIRAALETLAFDLPEAERNRWLARAEREAERLTRLLEDLTVDVAPPRARSVPIREVLLSVKPLLAGLIAERGVELKVELPPLNAWADADKLLQVLLNLIENALLHGPANAQVRVVATLSLSPRPAGLAPRLEPLPSAGIERWIHIEVFDSGSAADPDVIERWFAPHTRAPSATVRGTGLGLYIVRSIARRWGGDAWGRPWTQLPAGGESKGGNVFGFSVPSPRSSDAGPT
jgi:two-component system phosphate regulon sensor histidine kinase PhoR